MSSDNVIYVTKSQGQYYVWEGFSHESDRHCFKGSDLSDFSVFCNRGDALVYAHELNKTSGAEYGVQEEDLDAHKEASYIKFRLPDTSNITFLMFGDILVIDPETTELIRIERDGIIIYQKEINK